MFVVGVSSEFLYHLRNSFLYLPHLIMHFTVRYILVNQDDNGENALHIAASTAMRFPENITSLIQILKSSPPDGVFKEKNYRQVSVLLYLSVGFPNLIVYMLDHSSWQTFVSLLFFAYITSLPRY